MRENYIPALIVGAFSFVLFRYVYLRANSIMPRIILVLSAFALAVPAVLFASNYALYIPYASWFVELHARPYAEVSSGLVGAMLGVMFASDKLRPNKINGPILIFCSVLAFVLTSVPFAKHLYIGADCRKLENSWKDGVCLQTSGYTCVPACAATVIRMLGGNVNEPELARAAGTTARGTEFWYLKRALRKYGYEATFHYLQAIEKAPLRSILGVKIGDLGHVVVLLEKNKEGLVIGEPLSGRKRYTWKNFKQIYQPEGTYYTIKKIQ